MAIRAIIFDCFGVLVLPGRDALTQDFPDQASQLHDLSLQSDYGYLTRDEFNQAASQLTGLSVLQFVQTYWAANVRNEAAFDWIRTLRATGQYRIGLLSNIGQGWLDDFMPLQERAELFDAVVLSGNESMAKPAPAIFELVARRLDVEPENCVMIDDLVSNIAGAQLVGMRGIVFGSTAQAAAELSAMTTGDYA